jgi:hypothetical protein
VRIHADQGVVPDGAPHVALLDPFWGPTPEDPRDPTAGRFRRWGEEEASVYELVELDDADCVVLPTAWEHYEGREAAEAAARALAERAHAAGKPLALFFVSDSTAQVPLPGAHVFRTSLNGSMRNERVHAMPALSADLGEAPPRSWRERPVVGFCGFAPGYRNRPLAGLRRRLRGRREHPASVRGRACRALERSAAVDTRFVVRTEFWAGALRGGAVDYERMRQARGEFAENVRSSDYVLAARGGGNFSYRLYEAMSAGRIPLFVDTDCVLPFEDEIDWRSLVPWVDASELADLGDRVAAFHAELGPEGFRERQRECRQLWEQLLSPEGFYRSLAPRLAALPA